MRKGMMKGSGKRGYHNIIGKDPMVHSQSAKGIKQPQTCQYMFRKTAKTPKMFAESKYPFTGDVSVKQITLPYNSTKFKIYSDRLVLINGRLFETKEDLKRMPDKVTIIFDEPMIDSDGDGMPDFMDCQKNNAKMQDDMPVMEIDDFADSQSRTQRYEKLQDIDEFVAKIEKKNKIPPPKEIKAADIDRPEELDVSRQTHRVAEIERQIESSKDESEESSLFSELKKEREQLRAAQEKVTEIGLKDMSEQQLKNFAVRDTGDSGFLASIFQTKNKYEKELIRRIDAKKRLDRDLQAAVKKPVPEPFFKDLFKF